MRLKRTLRIMLPLILLLACLFVLFFLVRHFTGVDKGQSGDAVEIKIPSVTSSIERGPGKINPAHAAAVDAGGTSLSSRDAGASTEEVRDEDSDEAPAKVGLPSADGFIRDNRYIDERIFTMKGDYEGLERSKDIDILRRNLEIIKTKDSRAQKLLDGMDTIDYYLIRAAGNNPMMMGPVLQTAERTGTPPELVNSQEETIPLGRRAPCFLQWDRRWADLHYGDNVAMITGCVPTTLAMAVSGLTDRFVSPRDVIAQVGPGEYLEGEGTAWSFVHRLPGVYGLEVAEIPYDQGVINAELDKGHMIIVALGPGHFTFGGHFILLLAYDEAGYTMNDANSYENTMRSWSFEEIVPVGNVWSIG